jgi:uncharacterized protein (DUF1697 family)
MKYVAFLRGINVGGKNIIKMTDLKNVVDECGFCNVSTYIQSGNIIFESEGCSIKDVSEKLEACLLKYFAYDSCVVIRNQQQMEEVISAIPDDWEKRDNLRCYIAFIKEPISENDVLNEVELKEGIDFVKTGLGVLYLSTLLTGLTRSRLTKLVSKPIYKKITIRNYKTVQKIVSIMTSRNS